MFHFVVIILFLPILSQLFLGSFSIADRLKVSYSLLTRVNSVLAIALVVASPKLLDYEAKVEHVTSLMPRTTFHTLIIFLFLVFLGVIACQLVWKKGHKKRMKRERQFRQANP